jgi:hypothetical protein
MRKVYLRALLLGSMVVVAGPATADLYQSFTGNTTNGPTFNRPEEDGSGLSGQVVRHRAQVFQLLDDTVCTFYSTQDYDGYLHLYDFPFNPGSPLTNLIAGDDDAELGIGTSRIPRNLDTNSINLPADVYVLVNSSFLAGQQGAFQNFIQCDGDVQPLHSGCFFAGYPREKQICLQDRFAVKIDQISNHAGDGRGTPVRFGSTDSGFFWFFNDRNFEAMIKVLNGCAINGHWWVFFAATTNQAHRIQVGDANTQVVRTYNRALGPPAAAETDVTAFDCP